MLHNDSRKDNFKNLVKMDANFLRAHAQSQHGYFFSPRVFFAYAIELQREWLCCCTVCYWFQISLTSTTLGCDCSCVYIRKCRVHVTFLVLMNSHIYFIQLHDFWWLLMLCSHSCKQFCFDLIFTILLEMFIFHYYQYHYQHINLLKLYI